MEANLNDKWVSLFCGNVELAYYRILMTMISSLDSNQNEQIKTVKLTLLFYDSIDNSPLNRRYIVDGQTKCSFEQVTKTQTSYS